MQLVIYGITYSIRSEGNTYGTPLEVKNYIRRWSDHPRSGKTNCGKHLANDLNAPEPSWQNDRQFTRLSSICEIPGVL